MLTRTIKQDSDNIDLSILSKNQDTSVEKEHAHRKEGKEPARKGKHHGVC